MENTIEHLKPGDFIEQLPIERAIISTRPSQPKQDQHTMVSSGAANSGAGGPEGDGVNDTYTRMIKCVEENDYVKNCKSCKKRDPSSLSHWITRTLGQSDCIKLGIGVEKTLSDIVTTETSFRDIKPKNTKGKKERDHLFIDDINKIVYYAELKANINLDTEKSKSTYMKCRQIVEELKLKYPGYTISWCLLGYNYLNITDIPSVINKKYEAIKDNLFGINDYFKMLQINYKFDEEHYKLWLNYVADRMFE